MVINQLLNGMILQVQELLGGNKSWLSQEVIALPPFFGETLPTWMIMVTCKPKTKKFLGGGFKHVLFSPLPGEMIQFDYFSDGLKPPTRFGETCIIKVFFIKQFGLQDFVEIFSSYYGNFWCNPCDIHGTGKFSYM